MDVRNLQVRQSEGRQGPLAHARAVKRLGRSTKLVSGVIFMLAHLCGVATDDGDRKMFQLAVLFMCALVPFLDRA